MEGLSEHLSLLSRFAIAIGFAVLLPKAMERRLSISKVLSARSSLALR